MEVCDSASRKLCTGESCSRKTHGWLGLRSYDMLCAVKSVLETGKSNAWLWDGTKLHVQQCLCAFGGVCDYIFNHVMCFLSFLLQDLSWCVVQKERYLCQEQACSYCSVPSPIALFTERSLDSAVCFELHNFFSSWVFLWSQFSEAQCFTGIELTFAIWEEDIFSICPPSIKVFVKLTVSYCCTKLKTKDLFFSVCCS